ncbi:phage holin family protein [Cohnella thailandensis]|uniref:Phage holin family protein n=1 Tax=Cohnella thailandensis TaxID=557557 RepID=A0A841SRF3_9BACL|nr:phage holin family protein [Cohnella thailandensis]MBB6632748.1 phage holin family protein [Cohnella thailandensis]MBP1975563.1 toxin secretion/phage lysis holin [Cohnella thailandensis]
MNQTMNTILTAAAASSGKEAAWGGWVAAAGLVLSAWLGGWDEALQILVYLMVADYITGVLGAVKLKKVNSDIMFWGGIRKVTVLFVVGLAALLDGWIQPGEPIFRTIAIYFYVGREGLSVVENLGTLNVPMPKKLKELLEQLQEKGGGKTDGNL